MKQFLLLFLAASLGSLLTLAVVFYAIPPTVIAKQETAPTYSSRMVHFEESLPVAIQDFREAARMATPAVVHISSIGMERADNESNPFRFFFGEESPYGNDSPARGSGSGVIYSADGYIITNNHVVADAKRVEVTLYDNKKYVAEVIGTDEKSDLAVLKIEGRGLPTLTLADSDEAEIGEWVLAIGNPLELSSTVTAGIISAKGRSINLLGGGKAIESFIQTDAAVNPGNSGGALVDAKGNLLGINTAIATRTGLYAGYSFAIPVNLVTRIADDIIRYGSFQRGYLGIEISNLDAEYASELGVSLTQGVVVERIQEGGSAEFSGLQKKDIIVGINGSPVKGVPELQEKVGRARPGEEIELEISRSGSIKRVIVLLKSD